MRNRLNALLSREWAGLAIAAVFTGTGLAATQWLVSVESQLRPIAMAVIAVVGAVMALGALRHLTVLARVRRAAPAPGRRVDLGGYCIHVQAEGEAREGRPAIVWFPGGHAGAVGLHHLHRALREETRSILLDRPGTGWSDVGPFPRTTAREADEVVKALQLAGEKGPFVFAGHSFGGLLAANIARRYPALVHTVVLLDATPLDTIVYGPRLAALKAMRHDSLRAGVLRLFGIDYMARYDRRLRRDPPTARSLDTIETALGPEVKRMQAVERSAAGPYFAAASIYRELDANLLGERIWDTVVYDGDLGGLPVLVVAPGEASEIASLPEAASASELGLARMQRFYSRNRERYLASSSLAQRVIAPPGTGHNFVFEVPEFVIGVFREVLRRPADSSRA